MKEKHKQYIYIGIISLALVAKFILTCGLPIYVRDSVGADEYLMLEQAESLLKGDYLGQYTNLTLVKGIMFPMFLAIINTVGISYLEAVNLLYSIACIMALYSFGYFIKNKVYKCIFFVVLMFMPYTYSQSTMLVYRDSITPALSIMLLSGLFIIFLNLDQKFCKSLIWGIVTTAVYVVLWNTREDTIWTIPLIIVFMILAIGKAIKLNCDWKKRILTFGIIILPICGVFCSKMVISTLNYENYGIRTTNELNDSNYTKAVMLIMSVKPEEEIDYVEITHETLQRIYEVSPAFATLEDVIESQYDQKVEMLTVGYNPDNGEFNADWITWILRGAAQTEGYYETAEKAEAFWGEVADEVQRAIDDGTLETHKIMPTRSLIYWPDREDNFVRWFKSFLYLYKQTCTFDWLQFDVPRTPITFEEEYAQRYEAVTGNYSVDSEKEYLNIAGWCFSKNGEKYIATIEDNDGEIISNIEFIDSEDLYTGFVKNQAMEYQNARKARFSQKVEIEDKNLGVWFVVRDTNNEVIGKVNLQNQAEIMWNESAEHAFDYVEFSQVQDFDLNKAQVRIARLNFIKHIYKICNIVMAIFAILYFAFLTFVLFFKKTKSKYEKWVFLAAIFFSNIVVILALAYIDAFMFNSVGYLATAYALVTLFNVSGFVFGMEEIITNVREKHKGRDIKNVRTSI